MYLIVFVVYYRSPIIYGNFHVFEDGLSKPVVATMAEGSISTSDLPLYILDGLFDSFGKEAISDDDDIQNYDDVDLQTKLTMTA